MFGIFNPKEHIAPLLGDRIDSTYKQLRWQLFLGTFFDYAGYMKDSVYLQITSLKFSFRTNQILNYWATHMNVINIVSNIARVMLVGGILISVYFYHNPKMVMISSVTSLVGMLVLKVMSIMCNRDLLILDIAQSTERSFLMEIKRRVENEKSFNDELISLCSNATNEVEAKYKVIYNLNRPVEAACRKNLTEN